jgi:osmoprotectant transport system permease protein
MSYLATHPGLVFGDLLVHAEMVAIALAIGIAIALPIGVLVARRPRLANLVLGLLGAIYTIPSLAMLAVLVQIEGLGFPTAVTALVLYAQVLLVRNIVAAFRSLDPAQLDAATGLGMSAADRLLRVELPQALPVILGGVRIAIVSLIAIGTVAAWIDAGGLGVLIFDGLHQDNVAKTIAGSISVAFIAIVADVCLRVTERAAAK